MHKATVQTLQPAISIAIQTTKTIMHDNDDQLWGAPWRKCQVGWLAVASCDFPGSGLGIAVYHILAIQPDTSDDSDNYRCFTGRQYHCTVSNSHASCVVEGVWTKHRYQSSETVYDWEVVMYFPGLAPGNRLPADVVNHIQAHANTTTLFAEI